MERNTLLIMKLLNYSSVISPLLGDYLILSKSPPNWTQQYSILDVGRGARQRGYVRWREGWMAAGGVGGGRRGGGRD